MAKFERTIPPLADEDTPAAHDFLVEAVGFEAGVTESLGCLLWWRGTS